MPSIVLLQRDHEASPRLGALIDASENFSVSGIVHTVEQARNLFKQETPDILVTDMRVQDGDVQPLLIELRHGARSSAMPHILVTMVSHDDVLLLEALRAGADGYWVHTTAPEALIASIEQLWRGESPISPTIARQVLSHFLAPSRAATADTMTEALNALVLTDIEQEILQWAAQGYLIDEIAQQWQSSVHSVACGIRRVYHKLQFDLRANGLSLKAA
jgi:DNA-binding NarL/FixJ family response regulator